MIYQLDYVGDGTRLIFGVGKFGSEQRTVVVRDAEGNLVLNEDGTPQVKEETLKFGPHEVSESIAHQYETEELQSLGWIVIRVDPAQPEVGEIKDLGGIEIPTEAQ